MYPIVPKKTDMEPENGPLEKEIPFQNKTHPNFRFYSSKFLGFSDMTSGVSCVNPAPNNFGTNKNRGTSMSCSKCIAVKLDTPMAWTTPRLLKSDGRGEVKKVGNIKPSRTNGCFQK